MKWFQEKLISVTALASTSLAFAVTAHAQTVETDTRAKIDEVQVTARREAESIQSVPVSVIALSGDILRQKNVSSSEDVQLVAPGVFMSGSGGRQNVVYSIRGQSKALSGPSSPAVIAYFAEVPEVSFGSAVSQYDLASVQVLKGPQGTLFGRNTLGGAVLYTPAAPTYTFGGDLSVAIGNYNNREFKGAINVPIIDDKLAVRLAGDVHRRNGWAKDIGTDTDLEDINSKAFRLSVLFDPIEGVSNTLVLDYYKSRDNGFESLLSGVNPDAQLPSAFGLGPAFAQQYAEQQGRDEYHVNYNFKQFTKNERFGATDRLEVNLAPGYDLINIFGYRSTQLSYNTNVDGMANIASTVAPGVPVKFILGDLYDNTHQYSDELQLRGLSFSDKLDWLAGLFWLKSEPSGVGGNLVAFAYPLLPPTSGYTFITQTSKAVFLNGKYDLGDFVEGVKFNAGIRYTKDKTEACTGSSDVSGVYDDGDCKHGVAGLINPSSNTAESNATTWNIGLDWQIDPDLFSYIVARHGYRAGGVNGPTLGGKLATYQTFDPDTVTDVEVGVRSDVHFGDALLRSNVSVFSGWYDKVQLPISGLSSQATGAGCNASGNPDGDCIASNDPAGGTLLVNAGKTRVSGVDYDFTFVPDDHWTFNVSGTFLKLETRSMDIPDFLLPYLANAKELPFNNAAKKTVTSAIQYQFPLRNNMGDVALNLNYYWTGEMAISSDVIPSYGVFNGRVDWNNVAQGPVDLSLFAKNIGDKVYETGGVASGGTLGLNTRMVGAPRTYGVEARYRF
ncbi:MAG: hypothetical protein JWM78_992 [Verrucomicrobiaceae bacterium]|nr:hypothetical protein [Verrucomicrobiaceae bacterium]